MDQTSQDFRKDIERIEQIPIVSTLLDVVCKTTGMGFAAIARVTEDRWITLSVQDDLSFGLVPGSELQIKTTICNEVRHDNRAVVIDNVALDPIFADHHTPKMYGFQSYISVPIIRKDGSFFGTLCAIDPQPRHLNNPAVVGMFNLFAELVAFHLQALEDLELSQERLVEERIFNNTLGKMVHERTQELEEKNSMLEKMNTELESFAFISSHDLQEPLRKIQTFASRITENEEKSLSVSARELFGRIIASAKRMQILIDDLLTYSRSSKSELKFEITPLNKIIDEVKANLREELDAKDAVIETGIMCDVSIIPFQFHQIFYNLISNALKFSSPERRPVIKINSEIQKSDKFNLEKLVPETNYCHITVVDNGIGFDQQYHEKIFELFQRLHGKADYPGTGLGLAIVKRIVDNHLGFITAKSQLNKGATFDIYLPMHTTTINDVKQK